MRFHRFALAMLVTLVASLALASAASASVGRVVALGDSVASGDKLGPPVPGSIGECGQSLGSYPELAMARAVHSDWVNATCNGGHAGVMFYNWHGMGGTADIPAQFDSLNGSEDVVVVGSGGNEAYFGEVIGNCLGHYMDYNANTCIDTYGASGSGLVDKVNISQTKMTEVLVEIHRRSPKAKIFLIGTPRFTPLDGAGCFPNPILTPADAPVWAIWEDTLRQTMIKVAAQNDASFVDMQAISGTTHTMCAAAATRWLNKWTVDDIPGAYQGLALHDTPAGADATATAIVSALQASGLDTVNGPTGSTGGSGPSTPTVARTGPTSNPTGSTSQKITFSGTAGNTLKCKLDGAAYATCPSSPVTRTGLTNGTHTYYVTQTTPGNATSQPGTVTWTVDTTGPAAPTATRTGPAANPTNSSSQAITYSGAEAGGTFQCKLDSAAWAACPANPVTLTGLGAGTHTYSVTQTDAVGNVGSATTITWTIDTTPPVAPTVTRTSPTASPTNSTSQTIAYSGLEAGATAQCKLDAAAYGPCPASPATVTGLSNGSHTYSATQTDTAGNVSIASAVTWTVDSIAPGAPGVTRTSPTASPTSSKSQTLSYNGAEGGGTFQCKLDSAAYGPCQASPVTLTSLTEGSHTYSVTQTDTTGNVSVAGTVTWSVDSIAPGAPSVARTSPTASPTSSTSQTLSYGGAEGGGTFQCKLDSASYAACPSSPLTVTGLSVGSHTYSVTQTDAAGNVSIAGTATWTVDTVAPAAPTVTRTAPTANPTTSTSQTISYSGAEAGGTFQCKLDSAAWAACPSSPLTLTGLAVGPHTYSVTQTDAAGNVGTAGTVAWTIGTGPVAPTVARTVPTANPTNSTSQTLTYSGAAGNTFKCKLDAAVYAACPSSPVTVTGLADGSHTYSVTQTDAESNVSPAGTVTWVVDATPPGLPTVTRTSPTANPTNSTTQVINYSGAEAGGTFQCKLDAAAFAACPNSPVTLTGLGAGTHTYSVTQTDAVGNAGSATSVTWVVDTTAPAAPTVTRTNPAANPTNSTSQTLTYSGEAGGSFQCKLDAAAYAACPSSPVTPTGLTGGSHIYSVTQTDASGNVSTAGTSSWTVDVTPPPVPSVSGPSGTAALTTATITYGDSEAGVSFQCKLDSAAWAVCPVSPIGLSGLSDGAHTYFVTATDAVGNVSSAGSASWTVDSSGFTVSITSGPNDPTNLTTASFAFVATITSGTSYECQLDSGAFASCTSPKAYNGLLDGTHTFSVHANNGAQTTPDATRTWVVDSTPPDAPTLARTSPTASPTNSTSQTLALAGAEPAGVLKCKLDGAAYATCPTSPTSPVTVTGLAGGTHTYSVTQTDAAGNTGSATSVTWAVDTTPPGAPTVSRTSPTVSPTNATSQTIAYSGEAGGSFQCKLDAAAYGPCQVSPLTLTGLTDGSHTFSVTQTDAAGNVSAAGAVSWTVDTTAPGAPTLARTTPTANPTSSTTQSLSYNGAEAGGTFQCKLDGAAFASCPVSPVTVAGLSDGSHTYFVTQTDAAGNISAAGTATWTVDTVAPTAPTVTRSAPTANPTTATSQTISYSGAEAGGTFKCKLDGAAWAACPVGPVTATGLADGSHTYSVTQTDAAGNTGSATTVTWVVDTTTAGAPSVTRTNPTGTPTNSTSQTIAYSGEAGGSFQCKLDAAAYAPCPASPVTLNGLAEGSHTYSVTQTDAASNVSAAGAVSWTVDTTAPGAPTLARTTPTASPTSSTSQSLTYNGAEAGGTFQCKLDGAAVASCPASSVTVTGLTDGAHTYSVTQTDAAGNTGSATTIAWVVDTTPPGAPTLSRTSPTANPTNSTSQTLAFAGAEPGGVLRCKLDNAAYATCPSSPVTVTGLASGTRSYSVTQTDAAGNTGSAATVTWVVDTTTAGAPTVARASPAGTPTNSTSQTITYSGEAGSTFQCKLDAAAYAPCPASPVTLTALTDGSHTYSVTQTDAADNVSAAGTATWTVDTVAPTAPTATRTAPAANPTSSTSQTISYSGAEAGGTFQCKLDGTTWTACPGSPVTVAGLSDGSHTYSVTQTDAAGNTGSAATVTWVVDTTPPSAPTVTRTSPTGTATSSTSQSITYNGEAGATFQCKLDAAAYGPCPGSPLTLTSLMDGPHTYSVTQTDAAGNISAAGTATWTIDTIAPDAPAVTRTAPTADPTTSTAQTIAYSGEAGGTFDCKLDSAVYAACPSSPLILTGLGVGPHTYSVTQTDAAGNVSAAGAATWAIEAAPTEPTPPTGPTGLESPLGQANPPDKGGAPGAISVKISAVTPRTIVPARSGPTFSLKAGSGVGSFRVTISTAATVRMRLERVGVKVASIKWTQFKLRTGVTKIRVSGRAGGRALTTGRYKVHLAVNGAPSELFSQAFRISR